MKRVGHLIEPIAELDNLNEAFMRAARGKRNKAVVQRFASNLQDNLQLLRSELLGGKVKSGTYHFFTIYDPKQRVICAAQFRDRVLFHAIMRVCHKVFDDYQIYDSYASRPAKGTYKALERAQYYCGRYKWFAKLDMKKYFDSIDHTVLKNQLRRIFKDKRLMDYFDSLIDGYHVKSGKGVPIGNLTSQYFANHYLAQADHYAKETLHVDGFVRYMDDVLMFGDDAHMLKQQVKAYRQHVENNLQLAIHPTVMNTTAMGVPFLGYVVKACKLRLNGRSSRRLRHKMGALAVLYSQGVIDEKCYASRATALLAFATKAHCKDLLNKMYSTPGMYPHGL